MDRDDRSLHRFSSPSLASTLPHSSASASAILARVMAVSTTGASSALISMNGCWWRDVLLVVDRAHRAFGDADGAVDAFVRVDDEEVRALAKRIDGAHVDAVGVLAVDAGFGDDEGHRSTRRVQPQQAPPEQQESPAAALALAPMRVICTRHREGPASSTAHSN